MAVGAHRLGVKVDALFVIGDDDFAPFAERALTRAGLPSSFLRRKGATTGSGVGFTDASGETCLAVYPGANRLLTAADVRSASAAVRRASLVVAQFEIADEPIREAFRLARASGARTLLNPSPCREIDQNLLGLTSILVMNAVEAAWLERTLGLRDTGLPLDESMGCIGRLAAVLLDRGPDLVVVTLGRDGALAFPRGTEPLRQPAFPVRAVDSLGAGDAFTAGLAASLIAGVSLTDGLERAAACGAIATQRLGVLDALPTREQLGAFLEEARVGEDTRERDEHFGMILVFTNTGQSR